MNASSHAHKVLCRECCKDDHQSLTVYGFKQHSSCSHALFKLRTVIDHYVKSSSTVNICALDISEAFDKVDHFALLQLLMNRLLPRNFIGVLLNWFTKCFSCVRWGSHLSYWFSIKAGVRQGGCLSPILFAMHMDVLIGNLKYGLRRTY